MKICGLTSKNNRQYKLTALQEAVNLYDNKPIFVEHAQNPRQKRSYLDLVGNLINPRVENEGLYADVSLNPHKTLSEAILWDFQHNTQGVGMSHSVEGDCNDGIVESISEVHSVDLCYDPATTSSLKEAVEEETEEVDPMKVMLDEHHDRLNSHHERINKLEECMMEESKARIAELETKNKELLEEVKGLKNKEPVVSRIASPILNKEEFNLDTFVRTIKGKK